MTRALRGLDRNRSNPTIESSTESEWHSRRRCIATHGPGQSRSSPIELERFARLEQYRRGGFHASWCPLSRTLWAYLAQENQKAKTPAAAAADTTAHDARKQIDGFGLQADHDAGLALRLR